MPSSMIFAGLVVIWLLILVPAVARHRQEVARPSVAALSGRVLERPRRRQTLEVDVMDSERTIDDVQQLPPVATRSDDPVRVPAARDGDDGYGVEEPAEDDHDLDADGRRWEHPTPGYRPGRGGFDAEAAALAAGARYAFRQRVVLAMLVAAIVTGVLAAIAIPELWLPHAALDFMLIGYLGYLRRQVRMEESIRERRAARMAGTRRPAEAGDAELDEWTRPQPEDALEVDEPDDWRELAGPDELIQQEPDRVSGVGEPLRAPGVDTEPALPRLQPVPPPPLPPGTSLVEIDDQDPELHTLDEPVRHDYRRAAGQ